MKAKLFLFLSLVVLTFGGCKKDNDDSSTGGTSGLKVKTSLSGRIFDESGIAVSGATVMAGNVTAITDQYGIYTIADVELAKERAIVTINKGGYWQQVGSCIPSAGITTYRNFTLFNGSNTQIVNGASGGTVTHANGGSVTFPANAFVTASGNAYTGNVNVCMHRIAADDSTLGLKVPGSDLLAIDATNEDVILITYGMIGVKLTDGSGNTIKIADGKKASIKFPIAVGQLSSAPATIDLWYFDESIGKWKEEGTATKIGNNYEGDVAHFSWWNCDMGVPIAYISGTVYCGGTPVPNAIIEVNYSGGGICVTSLCDGYGNFGGGVPANTPLEIRAQQTNNSASYTQNININLASGFSTNNYLLQIIDPNCGSSIYGQTVNCNNTLTSSNIILLDSNNKFVSHAYAYNGVFNINAPQGLVKVSAYSGSNYGFANPIVNANATINIGNILLCNSISNNNNFTLTFSSTGVGTFLSSFKVSSCEVIGTSPNMSIRFNNVDSITGSSSQVELFIPNYAIGNYLWNGTNSTIVGSFLLNGINYSISQLLPSAGLTSISKAPNTGGFIEGGFNGQVILTSPGNPPITGLLTTGFNIYRNN